MNAKETDQRACNINAAGCAMLRKNFTPGHARTKSRGMVDLSWQGAGTWRTQSGHMAGAWWTHTRQTQEADRGRTRFGGAAKRTHGGHVADTRR